jgi:hypothetical protein
MKCPRDRERHGTNDRWELAARTLARTYGRALVPDTIDDGHPNFGGCS